MTATLITIEEQQAALQPLLAAVSGILKVEVDWPDALQPRELPGIVLTPSTASYDTGARGAGSLLVRRRWKAVLYAAQATEGREYQAEKAVKPFLTSIPLALAAHPTIRLADGREFRVRLAGGDDTGPGPMKYNGKPYTGAVITFITDVETFVRPV